MEEKESSPLYWSANGGHPADIQSTIVHRPLEPAKLTPTIIAGAPLPEGCPGRPPLSRTTAGGGLPSSSRLGVFSLSLTRYSCGADGCPAFVRHSGSDSKMALKCAGTISFLFASVLVCWR